MMKKKIIKNVFIGNKNDRADVFWVHTNIIIYLNFIILKEDFFFRIKSRRTAAAEKYWIFNLWTCVSFKIFFFDIKFYSLLWFTCGIELYDRYMCVCVRTRTYTYKKRGHKARVLIRCLLAYGVSRTKKKDGNKKQINDSIHWFLFEIIIIFDVHVHVHTYRDTQTHIQLKVKNVITRLKRNHSFKYYNAFTTTTNK